MPAGGYRCAFLLLAVSHAPPAASQNVALKAPDAARIMADSIATTERHWQARLRYTWVEREESRRRDSAGRVKSESVGVSRTVLVDGIPFEQLMERNGQQPSPEELRQQGLTLARLKMETAEERSARLRIRKEENASLVREVPKAFDFRLVGEETVEGREAWVLQAVPRPGYQPQGRYGKMFPKVEGRLWVDKHDLAWIKVDGYVTRPFSVGLFLARVLQGSRIRMEQTRVDDGIWMPAHVEVRAEARIFLLKSIVIERILTWSEYRLPEGGGVPEAPGHAVQYPAVP